VHDEPVTGSPAKRVTERDGRIGLNLDLGLDSLNLDGLNLDISGEFVDISAAKS
jgi:hypothetical protein